MAGWKPHQLHKLGVDPGAFPPVALALEEPDGLLCFGGDLEPDRLLQAYVRGIFPWFNDGDPILWWSPDPRWILPVDSLHISKRDRQFFRHCQWRIELDRDFESTIQACAAPRKDHAAGEPVTWISPQIVNAYQRLFELGFAHSLSVHDGERTIAGIYGIAIGRVFFAESMFGLLSNASKAALCALVTGLRDAGFAFLDCQVHTDHVEKRGAFPIDRQSFVDQLAEYCLDSNPLGVGPWSGKFPISQASEI